MFAKNKNKKDNHIWNVVRLKNYKNTVFVNPSNYKKNQKKSAWENKLEVYYSLLIFNNV